MAGLPNPMSMPNLGDFGLKTKCAPENTGLPNPLQMPSLKDFKEDKFTAGGKVGGTSKLDNTSTKQMQMKINALDNKKPIPSDS